MKIEDQVCTLEQAKKIKELGIEQHSCWYWIFTSNESRFSISQGLFYRTNVQDILINNQPNMKNNSDSASAFTVSELGEMLPEFLYLEDGIYRLISWRYTETVNNETQVQKHSIAFEHKDKETLRKPQFDKPIQCYTEAQARAAMLIYLLENKLATPEEVNHRLQG